MTWAQGSLTASGDLAWIAALPLEYRLVLTDGTRVLCVHASPGQDDGLGIRPVIKKFRQQNQTTPWQYRG